jgi:hypothetical protein
MFESARTAGPNNNGLHSTPFFISPYPTFTHMFKIIVATCLVAGLSSGLVALAKTGPKKHDPTLESRATTLTRALAQHIPLNEAQYIAVKKLHLEMLTERRNLEIALSGANAAERDTRLAEVQFRYETRLNNLLRPQQVAAYQALRTNMTAHRIK